MFTAWQDNEIVGLISAILGIVLTLLKFFIGRKEEPKEALGRWSRFKRGVGIFVAGFLLGIGLCFYLFVSSEWKVKKAFQRFLKKDVQHNHQKKDIQNNHQKW